MENQEISVRNFYINASKILIYFIGYLFISSFWTWAKSVFPFYNQTRTDGFVDEKNQLIALFALNGYLGLIGILLTIFLMIYVTKTLNNLKV